MRCKINYTSNLPSNHLHPFSSSIQTKRERERERTLTMKHGESKGHQNKDWTTMSTQWMTHPRANWTTMNNPPLSWFDHHVNDPLLDLTTVGDPRLDQAITLRSTHYVHVAITAATTKSPMNLSLSLSLSHVILILLFWFLFLFVFIYWDFL